MDPQTLTHLAGAPGTAALEAAARLDPADPLAAASALRAAGVPERLASAALAQSALRRRAVAKFGPDAANLFFTRTGLEQATRRVVADRRAARLAAAGVRHIADLGCGIGADTIAFARAGLSVSAVESDPLTAAVVAANVAALGLTDQVTVSCVDATGIDLSDVDAVYVDPARRDTVRRFDPQQFSPPWSYVLDLADRVPSTVVKLAPGLDHALIPDGAEAEWVSVAGDLVEAALWFGPLRTVARRATVLRGPAADQLTGTGARDAPVTGIRSYLYEPDPAVVRARLLAEFAERIGGGLADPRIAYVFADAPVASPYARCFEVVEELPYALKRLRAALRERGIGQLEILKRGLPVEPDRLRRDLRLAGPRAASLVLARLGDTPTALLCQPWPG